MLKNINDLIFKIIIILLFVIIFVLVSNSNKSLIELGNIYLNSCIWLLIMILSIIIYKKYDKFLGTLIFILILLNYKKFIKDPFSLHESFYIIEELFTNQQNKNLGEFEYAKYPKEVEYSLDKYPKPTE